MAHMAVPQGAHVSETLTVEQIASRLQEMNTRRDRALKSYQSRRVMTAAYNGGVTDGQATETVLMTFVAPSSKHFQVLSSSGPDLIRNAVFEREMDSEQAAASVSARRQAALTPADYTMRYAGEERLPIGNCYVLEVSPKIASEFAYEGKVWVHSTDFAVVRIEGRPVQNPSFWIAQGEFTTQFEKVSDFYLPLKTVSSSQLRFGGTATFSIAFGPYRILSADPVVR